VARPRRTVADFTDPYIGSFTPPPPDGDGVCDVCHGAPNPGFSRCYSCSQKVGQVTHPIELVVPISLYESTGQLHHVLRSYKDGWTDEIRANLRPRVTALLWRFLSGHDAHIVQAAGAEWDLITSVPSRGPRVGQHPLELAIGLAPPLAQQYQGTLERGDGPLGHNRASDTGYVATADVDGANVLLVDDTFTTGARIQSAASALTLAGANVVAAVPIGRVINPAFNASATELWEAARAQPFDFDVCCLEP
jgi:predicted amidophosphoribosyltransferase